MERQTHQPEGGTHTPAVNSYGTDDPEAQAHIEHARVEAARERKRDRLTLERLVELGLNPDDAEVLIEFDHAMNEARTEGEHFRATSLDDTRRDLAELLALRSHPRGDVALADFAADLRKDIGNGRLVNAVPSSIASYQAAGLNRRDALTVADFEYYLRYKLASAGDPAASLGIERAERPPKPAPRVYVIDHRTDNSQEPTGQWVDVNQAADELEAAIAEAFGRQPEDGAIDWSVTHAQGFAGIDLFGSSDSQLVATIGQGVAEHGDAFAAWVELHGIGDADLLGRFNDFYIGSYQSKRDWAESIAADLEWLEHLDRVVEPTLRPYVRIDYDQVVRDTSGSWDLITGADGRLYVFLR
ncbi:antirestriction protein ArdA [Actinophytocola algeriensis]|uniref:Antirestriction protein n=1 Tax=Actinophytocola algeriensis TaxID=1768010 RepID=A0A7W7QBQ2_9PSEU|nr:antirestriction protein ArdA [Actinophytocola algeriensis]MBB4910533.1 antirestriction protein [Actinophytocola algeriensis]MBE1480478.1 antirestriction protein [Actinophytocola algeriensis]